MSADNAEALRRFREYREGALIDCRQILREAHIPGLGPGRLMKGDALQAFAIMQAFADADRADGGPPCADTVEAEQLRSQALAVLHALDAKFSASKLRYARRSTNIDRREQAERLFALHGRACPPVVIERLDFRAKRSVPLARAWAFVVNKLAVLAFDRLGSNDEAAA